MTTTNAIRRSALHGHVIETVLLQGLTVGPRALGEDSAETYEASDAKRALIALGATLQRFREAHELSQPDLAALVGMSQSAVSDAEQGKRSHSWAKLVATLRALHVGLPEFAVAFEIELARSKPDRPGPDHHGLWHGLRTAIVTTGERGVHYRAWAEARGLSVLATVGRPMRGIPSFTTPRDLASMLGGTLLWIVADPGPALPRIVHEILNNRGNARLPFGIIADVNDEWTALEGFTLAGQCAQADVPLFTGLATAPPGVGVTRQRGLPAA